MGCRLVECLRAIALGLVVALFLNGEPLCHAGPSRADAEGLAAWTFEEELSVEERKLLAAAAALSESDAAACASTARGCVLVSQFGEDWREAWAVAVRKLASAGGWRAAALSALVQPALRPPQPSHVGRVVETVLRVAGEKGGLECLSMKSPGDKLYISEATRGCLRSKLPDGERADFDKQWNDFEASYRFLIVRAMPGDEIDVVTSGQKSEIVRVEGPGKSASAALGPGRFLVAVRAGVKVTVRTGRGGLDTPLVFDASGQDLVDVRPHQESCLSLDVTPPLSAHDHIYVGHGLLPSNGARRGSTSSSVVVEVGSVRGEFGQVLAPAVPIAILKDGAQHRAPIVLATWTVQWSSLSEGGCHHVKLDLTPPDRELGVAVVGVEASEPCRARGLDDADLRRRAEAALERIGQRVKSAQRWAATTRQLGELLRDLNQGQVVGAPRGRLDSELLTKTGAAEFARQGFGSLLAVELGCYGPKDGEQERYGVQVYLLDLSKLVGPRDSLTGLELTGALRKESEAVSGDDQLDRAFVVAISKLFGTSYATIARPAEPRRFKAHVFERVDVYVPALEHGAGPERSREPIVARAKLESYLLGSLEQYICEGGDEQLQRSGYRAAREFWQQRDRGYVAKKEAPLNLTTDIETTNAIEWYPRRPGTYLLRFELLGRPPGEAEGRAVAYACAEIENFPNLVFADLSYSGGLPWTPAVAARGSSLSYGRLIAGLMIQPVEGGPWSLGFAAGYANAVHSLATPTAWELSPEATSNPVEYDPSGGVTLAWTRQSLLFGPVFSGQVSSFPCLLAVRDCTPILRGFDAFARVTSVFDVGRVFPSGPTGGLPRFFSNTGGLDLDLTTFVDLGIRWRVGLRTSLYVAATGALVGWDDFVLGGRVQSGEQGSVTYDARVTAGGAFGAAWGF